MINIKGYNFFLNKNIFSSLLKIYGIGFFRAKYICNSLNINIFKKNKFLSSNEIRNISEKLNYFKIGDELKRENFNYINRLINLKCYRGVRHVKKLPVRGQNTKNNARTRKGPKKKVFLKKKINLKNVKKNK